MIKLTLVAVPIIIIMGHILGMIPVLLLVRILVLGKSYTN